MLRREDIKKYAVEAGFALCGVARACVLSGEAERLMTAAAHPATPYYIARDPSRRLDPAVLLAGARSVVVCALAYDGRPVETEAGRVSAHRAAGDYHDRVKNMLHSLLARLRGDFPELRGKVCCDTAPILEKAWATEAGLGWIGRNSLLINPVHGSFLLLGELILNADCDSYDAPLDVPGCGSCHRCVDACPVGALSPYRVDSSRCISSLTIERARQGFAVAPIHGWICGCDVCQIVCPHNK